MVLDCVVGAPVQILGDVRPPVAEFAVKLEQHSVLLDGPRILTDVVIEVVVPALPALLAGAAWKVLSHKGPRARAVHVHQAPHHVILVLGPLRRARDAGVSAQGNAAGRPRALKTCFRCVFADWAPSATSSYPSM